MANTIMGSTVGAGFGPHRALRWGGGGAAEGSQLIGLPSGVALNKAVLTGHAQQQGLPDA